MRISIAMATYNGAKFLQEQLESFLNQTRQPDELVVCDDGSTDATLEILEAFRQKAPFAVNVYRNEKNLGFIRNFEKSLSLCTGDIIFLSDQDDVWFESKVNNVVEHFLARDGVFVVANDAEITGEKLERTGFTAVGQVISAGLPIESFFVGCCMAFKSEFKALALPIPHEVYSHDGWINVLANRLGCRHSIPDVLQFYRRHGNNTSQSVTTSKSRAAGWRLLVERIRTRREIDPIAAYEIRYNQLTALRRRLDSKGELISKYLAPTLSVADVNKTLEVELKGNSERRALQDKDFFPRVVAAIKFYIRGGYSKFEGWQSLIRDIFK